MEATLNKSNFNDPGTENQRAKLKETKNISFQQITQLKNYKNQNTIKPIIQLKTDKTKPN